MLLAGGVIQNLHDFRVVGTAAGGIQPIPGGPVASQEAVKLMSGDGGGFFNANSAHPFENPNAVTNVVEIVLMLLIPSAVPRMYGRMARDTRQGWLLLGVMAVLFTAALGVLSVSEAAHPGTVPQAIGTSMEGKEARFGPAGTALFANGSTASADGAVDGSHDSLTVYGGGMALVNILLGEVSPGGVGSGLYGILSLALVAVFLGGLMIGRTPEYLGKRIGAAQIRLVALITLATPLTVLVGTGLALGLKTPPTSFLNSGAHGLSEGFYAFASAANTNGSAFAGLNANTDFYNIGLALAMLVGRYLTIVLVIALAGSLAGQRAVPTIRGTLATHTPTFAVLVIGVAILVGALTYLPTLALGPLADGLAR